MKELKCQVWLEWTENGTPFSEVVIEHVSLFVLRYTKKYHVTKKKSLLRLSTYISTYNMLYTNTVTLTTNTY